MLPDPTGSTDAPIGSQCPEDHRLSGGSTQLGGTGERACLALRQAKENRKNQCVEFTAGLDELQLSHCLAQSADNGFQGFRLVFQPICGADTLEVRGPRPS